MSKSQKQEFLEAFDREHEKTMRVLRAYPEDKLDLRPHPKLKNARELAWVFVLECGLGTRVWHDEYAKKTPSGKPPAPPEDWSAQLAALQDATAAFRKLIESAPDAQFAEEVHFMTGPKKMGANPRIDWLWFLLSDQIHHRGQFSVYLRMADGKVPSIYGPSGDEQWI